MTIQDNSGKTRLPLLQRSCGECTKCCEGWLSGVVHGHQMSRGCRCHYLESSCKIYEDRPVEPCRNYNCVWLMDEEFPGWMKPNISGVIISKRKNVFPTSSGMKSIEYCESIETSEKISSDVLNWIVQWSAKNKKNIAYEVNGGINFLGDEEFLSAMKIHN